MLNEVREIVPFREIGVLHESFHLKAGHWKDMIYHQSWNAFRRKFPEKKAVQPAKRKLQNVYALNHIEIVIPITMLKSICRILRWSDVRKVHYQRV